MIELTEEQLDHLAGVAWRAAMDWSEGEKSHWPSVVRAVVDAINAQPTGLKTAAWAMTDEQFAEFMAAFDAAAIRRRFREGSEPA